MSRTIGAVIALSVALPLAGGCVSRIQSVGNVINTTDTDFAKIPSYKKGESCLNNVLGIFNWGDHLVTSAVLKGKVRKLRFTETEFRSWVVFSKYCTIVYGE